ncbi:hypothetical protein G7092_01895 [Mucilaginibacter sp. HC2]|jgi:hypothetical protein|uniref:hypothetical protein n=1 Tax=Mucilaginibacter inviolabilis TaxID=2714892 RepID=UPI00140AE9CF|nr:hypothetical protein [Mucilaginibacter inviolabilis]NHA02526.1 hypothetical protein [Mucilaginibacter inviolabilis]
MTWIKFISWLAALYAFYYLLNIAWDLMRRKQTGLKEPAPELHFEETIAPLQVASEAQEEKKTVPSSKDKGDVATSALGGVRVKDLFQLAKLELIAYNQSVTF